MEPSNNPYIPSHPDEQTSLEASPAAQAPVKTPAITTPMAIIIAAIIVAIGLFLGLHRGSSLSSGDNAGAAKNTPPAQATSVPAAVAKIRPNDYVRGDVSRAQVALIEYSDSDCPFCMRFHPTLKQVLHDYGDKVVWVYRFFPLTSLHPNAYTEAAALQCVGTTGGNAKFWDYLDIVINVTLNPDPKSNEALTTYASSLGIDKAAFVKCMASTAPSARIDADIKEATAIGAQGTPFTVAVNLKTGKQVVIPGAYPIDQVKAMIDSLLK